MGRGLHKRAIRKAASPQHCLGATELARDIVAGGLPPALLGDET